ncbi:hypothetical protein CALCODRAFT_509780 [Calocera cornea HHB12733]|uniref:rRNA-processing protein n=1 Tax=Calocera cornea HHB12733 TaxID=1353952 RepID=A0A165F0B3_9BASI|nr:hypothetical protein CALCODRAFT_509780 [Calocera cornea HHB12733]
MATTVQLVQEEGDEGIALRTSAAGRESGKSWKSTRAATRRTQMPKSLKSKSWEARVAQRSEEDAVKKLARELQEEKQADKDRKRQITQDRRKAKEEKLRLESMAAKLSAKKIARMKKRAGRSKKVKG